jgi:hypothetical protein
MNNAASKDIFIEGFQVDLFIQDEDISLSEPNPGQGEIITIQASVHNRGGLGTGTDWVKKGVVLQNNSFSTGLDYPYILYHEGKYKMWYVGRDGGFGEIYYATSPDGYTWTEHGCVLPVPVGLNYAVAPSVLIEDDGTYKMWFTCQDGNWKARTYLATSYNGITWTNQGVALGIGSPGSSDDVYVVQAKVFKDGDKYKLYYKSYDSSSNKYFMFATSNDGYTWTKHGVVMDLPSGFTNMECPIVFKNDDGTYTMWYHLWQDSLGEIYRSHSQDGIVWSLGILDLGVGIPGELDDYFVVCPHLITDPISGNDWMYYTGSDGSEHRVFLAEKEIEYMGYDATCTVSFYLDSVASENLMYQECDVFVPADGTANVSCDWTPTLAGEHTIIVNISDSNPPESDLTNNQASKAVTVTPGTPACLDITKVKVSGIEEGYTFTYYEWVLQINITNTGGYLAQDVIVKDTLPAELVLLSLEPTSGIATYLGMCSNAGTRSNQKPVIWPIEKATHIEWIVGDLSPGQTESLTMTICTGTNPAGKQEFTSPGIYNLNDGAWAKGYDSLTGTQISAGPTPPITVNVSDLFRIPPLSGHWSQY